MDFRVFILTHCNLLFHFASGSIDDETRNSFRKRKLYSNSERRFHGDGLYKRRRFFDRSSVVNSDEGMSSESVSNSPEKSIHIDKSGLAAVLHGGPQLNLVSFMSFKTNIFVSSNLNEFPL